MELEDRVESLNTEQKAFFQHVTRPGSSHELIERQKELRSSMLDNSVGYNHKAAKLALVALGEKTAPAQVDEVEQHQSALIKVAQRVRNEGDDLEAARLLERVGLDLSALRPRANDDTWKQREEAA